jgi:outer membrane murein-binding lipoprotein Lpp
MRQIAVALVVVILAGCGTPARKVVVTDPWTLQTGGGSIEVIDQNKRLALRISGDGRIWEWETSPEKVVTALVAQIGTLQSQFQQYQQQVQAAMSPKPKAKPAPPAAVKKTEKPKEGK